MFPDGVRSYSSLLDATSPSLCRVTSHAGRFPMIDRDGLNVLQVISVFVCSHAASEHLRRHKYLHSVGRVQVPSIIEFCRTITPQCHRTKGYERVNCSPSALASVKLSCTARLSISFESLLVELERITYWPVSHLGSFDAQLYHLASTRSIQPASPLMNA